MSEFTRRRPDVRLLSVRGLFNLAIMFEGRIYIGPSGPEPPRCTR
jgi:hypothetical protein